MQPEICPCRCQIGPCRCHTATDRNEATYLEQRRPARASLNQAKEFVYVGPPGTAMHYADKHRINRHRINRHRINDIHPIARWRHRQAAARGTQCSKHHPVDYSHAMPGRDPLLIGSSSFAPKRQATMFKKSIGSSSAVVRVLSLDISICR